MRNILAVLVGLIIGGVINSLIIQLNGTLVPLPEGVDIKTPEGLTAAMSQMDFSHFLVVFLGHGLGTLFGAFITTKIARPKRFLFALIVGICFLAGGIYMVAILNAPMMFNIIDIVFAYIPMAWIGYMLVGKGKSEETINAKS